MRIATFLPAAIGAILLSACAQSPAPGINTTALTTSSTGNGAARAPVRGTPVVVGRPARVFIMVGFKEKDCSPIPPQVTVTTPPGKGAVSFMPNQTTLVQFSASGKCTGKSLPGTGIYYTARPGAKGVDQFTVTASIGNGAPSTKTFRIRIAE